MTNKQLEKIGKILGHELNLLFQKGKYLTAKGWIDDKRLAEITLEIIKGVSDGK